MRNESSIIEEYYMELTEALHMKREGVKMVAAGVAGSSQDMPIDDYICMWATGIKDMLAGANPEIYDY